ncbi:MAG: hypothetical protein AB7H90_12525 [Alphaproteobacteria bacterium]
MQTTGDRNTGMAASQNPTDQRNRSGAAGPATELGRHYGEHGHPATTNAGPAAQDSARDVSLGEQARSAATGAAEAARDAANRAREQVGPAAQAVYDQGARAGQYVTRNVHEYPATALLIAAAVGYGLAYLLHGGGHSSRRGRHEFHNRYDQGAH